MNTPKLTRKEQWTINSQRRRKAIIKNGGRKLLVMLTKDHSDLLDSCIARRRVADPDMNMTEWVRRMIVADDKQLARRVRQSGSRAKAGRSIGPSEP